MLCACSNGTYSKVGMITEIAWPLCEDDMQIHNVSYFNGFFH